MGAVIFVTYLGEGLSLKTHKQPMNRGTLRQLMQCRSKVYSIKFCGCTSLKAVIAITDSISMKATLLGKSCEWS